MVSAAAADVAPVPPCSIETTPDIVFAEFCGAEELQVVPLDVNTLPLAPGATTCKALVPLPSKTLFCVNVFAPVPPFVTDKVPVTPVVRGTLGISSATNALNAGVPPNPELSLMVRLSKFTTVPE